MSLRRISLVLVAWLAVACGGSARSEEPTTAAEKQRRAAEAAGATDEPKAARTGWRYTGDRDDCFFVVGRRCFKTEAAACTAARCGKTSCEVTGGGPAHVSCTK